MGFVLLSPSAFVITKPFKAHIASLKSRCRGRALLFTCASAVLSSAKPKRADGESYMFVTVASRGALHTLDALRDRLLAATER
jgi:hypothetical protein